MAHSLSPPPHAAPSPPLVLPRGVIFFGALWLIGSWWLAIGLRTPVQPSSASYTPGVRLMLLCITIGLMIGWPLLRLSQRRPHYPVEQTLLDICVLLGLVQVVVWPLRLVTPWTVMRTAAIDASIAGWVLLAAAVVAAALTTDRHGPRILAMTACLAMCLLGPALAWIGVMTGVESIELVELSPLIAMRTLGEGGGTQPTPEQWQLIILLAGAAALAWAALLISLWLRAGEAQSVEVDAVEPGDPAVND